MVNLKRIKRFFSPSSHSTNIVRDVPDERDFNKNFPEELLQFFPHHQATLCRRFSENFYNCLDVHRRPRLVKKSGELNIHTENVHKRRRRLWSDIFNTILDIKWRWHFGIFLFSFIFSWFFFASIWYLIAFFHGDLKTTELQGDFIYNGSSGVLANRSALLNAQSVAVNDVNKKKPRACVQGVYDFTSALLYSVETQHTIGYGLRYITEECSFAIIFLMIQSCFGIFVQGLVAGVVFAKISRPNKRKRTIIFSHNACVSERDGKLCFMFKLANIRISQLSDARIKMHMIKSRRTSEGEFIPFQSYDMKVGHNWSGNDSIFFPWPKTVEHVIDEDSPLYEMCKQVSTPNSQGSLQQSSKHFRKASRFDSNTVTTTTTHSTLLSRNASSNDSKSIKSEDYEIVVILEGNIETTGASCHIRTSYLPQEILFGYRFTPIYPKFTDFEYLFDYAKFDHVEPIQYELLGLNVAFTNKHLNYVHDARDESKNLYQTVQNTEQLLPGMNYNYKKTNPDTRGAENSIFSLLKRFGSNNVTLDEQSDLGPSKILESVASTEPVHQNLVSPLSEITSIKPEDKQPQQPSKTGRFTVQAVKPEITEQQTPLANVTACSVLPTFDTASSINEMKSSAYQKNSFFLKKTASSLQKRNLSKQVLFHLHNNVNSLSSLKHGLSNHHRASSLPPPEIIKHYACSKSDGMSVTDRLSFDNSMIYRKKANSLGTDDSTNKKTDNDV